MLLSAKTVARSTFREVAETMNRYMRSRLAVPLQGSGGYDPPTIFFLTPDYDLPSGGIRVIYRHVDILNAAGLKATVVHQRPGFRCSWFRNSTSVTDVSKVRLRPSDLLVLAEVDGDLFCRLAPGTHHVIFNQNSHLTWTRGGDTVSRHYATNPYLVAILTVSQHSAEMLRYAFPAARIERIHLGLDQTLFYSELGRRRRRMTFMPRRGVDDAQQVLQILKGRDALKDWDIVPLDGLVHEDVAKALRASQIFLAFTYQEGFGLPAAEAMACGNYVIGYHGFGGGEFFDAGFSTPIPQGDVLGFAKAVEQAISLQETDPALFENKITTGARKISKDYSLRLEHQEVFQFYHEALTAIGEKLHSFK